MIKINRRSASALFFTLILVLCQSMPAFAAGTEFTEVQESVPAVSENPGLEENGQQPDSKSEEESEKTAETFPTDEDDVPDNPDLEENDQQPDSKSEEESGETAETFPTDEEDISDNSDLEENPQKPDRKPDEETEEQKDSLTPEQVMDETVSGDEPEEVQPVDVVYNEEELAAWLEEHEVIGGTVTLGNMIIVTGYIYTGGYAENPIVIDVGEFGIVLDGGIVEGREHISITGEGVDVPVVDVLRAGGDESWDQCWNNTLMRLNITAIGRDGQGGIAMRILAEDSKAFSMESIYDQGIIRSYGTGAIGLWLSVPMEAYCYQVEVMGENSVAVHAPRGAELFYCKLEAEGENASTATGKNLLLDSCAAFPAPDDGVEYINRQVLETSFNKLYLPIKRDEPDYYSIYDFFTFAFFLSGGDGFDEVTRHFAVDWDWDVYDSIDMGVEGKNRVPGSVNPVFYGLGLFDDISLELIVEVRDPAVPCISQVSIKENANGRYARLNYWDSFNPQDENAVLWRSDDEGKTWWDATFVPEIHWGNGWLEFPAGDLDQPVWLQLELTGTGESNIVILYEKDGVTYGGTGGDRTGTDRGGVDTSGSDGGNNTGTGQGGGSSSQGNGSEGQLGSGNPANPGAGENEEQSGGDGNSNPSGSHENGNTQDHANQPGNNNIGNGSGTLVSNGGDEGNENKIISASILETESLLTDAAPLKPLSGSVLPSIQEKPDSDNQNGEKESHQSLAEAEEAITVIHLQAPLPSEAVPAFDPGQSAPSAAFGKEIILVFLSLSFAAAAALTAVKLLEKRR